MDERKVLTALEEAKIQTLPDTAYYIPNFITEEDEQDLLHRIQNRPVRDWTELSKRRLQTYPSPLSNDRLIDAPMPPWLVQPIVSRLTSIPLTSIESHEMSTTPPQTDHIFSNSPHHTPNHCLVNEYKPGQGIMPHEDGSAYHPVVATVSLGAPIVLDVHEKSAEGGFDKVPTFRILQEPRSLLITTGTLYADYLHGIARETKDKDLNKDNIANWDMLGEQGKYSNKSYERETRISLTYRDVKAVIKASRLIPGLSFGKR